MTLGIFYQQKGHVMNKKQAPHPDDVEDKFNVDKDIVVGMFEKLVDDTYLKGRLGTASESPEAFARIRSKLRCLEFSLTGAMNSLLWRLKENPEDEDHNPFKGLRSEIYLLLQAGKWAAQIHDIITDTQEKKAKPKKKKAPKKKAK
jgi:hypothetical protein